MTVTEFLEARIAEDEREARVCLASPEHTMRRWVRMLAECEAKGRIIDLHAAFGHSPEPGAGDAWRALGVALQDLAGVYADHPDYDKGWAL